MSQFALSAIGRQFFDYAFTPMQEALEDEFLSVRERIALIYRRLAKNDDGCQRIVQSGSPANMAKTFIIYSQEDNVAKESAQFLIHMLESMVNLTFSDQGIEPLLESDIVE